MSKRTLILVGIPDFDYHNSKSAVASFLEEVKKAIEISDENEVEFAILENETNTIDNLPQSKVGITSKLKKVLRLWPWLYHSLAYRSYFKKQNQLIERLKTRSPYNLIVEFHTAGSYVGKSLAEFWNCNLSVIFDAPVEEQFYEMHQTKSLYWRRIKDSEKETLEYAKKIMVYSNACEKHIHNKYQITAATNILPCVVDKKIVDRKVDSNFLIGFIGSFLVWHKVEKLVLAFQKFKAETPNAKLVLVGYGVEWERIQQQVTDLNIEAVEMPGFVSEEALLEYKQKLSVAIMPGSNWYGSPLKLFEYAKAKIPFIAPETPTVMDIFQRKEHCLYIDQKNEIDSILNHLRFIRDNTDKANDMALKVYEYVVTNFSGHFYHEKLRKALSN